jgi:hypothetical protein
LMNPWSSQMWGDDVDRGSAPLVGRTSGQRATPAWLVSEPQSPLDK